MFEDAIKTHITVFKAMEALAPQIGATGREMIDAFANGAKLLACGNGGSAADAQHFCAELMVKLKTPRRPLPAIALHTDTSLLTAAANDFAFDAVFSRQVLGLGVKNDLLLAISTSGNSANVLKAAEQAREMGITCIALTGADGGRLKALADIWIGVPSQATANIQEAHIFILHYWAGCLENWVLNQAESSSCVP